MSMKDNHKQLSRRDFLKIAGAAGAAVGLAACADGSKTSNTSAGVREVSATEMTMRTNPTTGEKVSLLGFGMMRLPSVDGKSAREGNEEIDQEMVNRLVDYAIAHGVNYFDTSPAYCRGQSERATGIALSRHPRKEHYIATKLSNFAPETWRREAAIDMFRNSLQELQTDYVDYLLMHGIGMPAKDAEGHDLNGMEAYRRRYEDNGIIDFLLDERKAGRIRNLGFSYHGDIEVFDYLLSRHEEYHWDFVQIQLNYLDWNHAKEINPRNTNAEYLYNELTKRGIPAVIMEPLLGGRLSNVPDPIVARLKQREPERSVASWAFRYAGSYPNVLTVLSGMTVMEHLQDNLYNLAPLKPLTDEEIAFLHDTATRMVEFNTIPCNDCKYCMPCPYGLNIPAILLHYNKCLNEGNLTTNTQDEHYREARRAFLVGYDRSVPKLRQASHCIGCGQCSPHCPQRIDIPKELHRIDDYVEQLKTS